VNNEFEITDETPAIFAQGTYDLSNMIKGLSFTAGARYTWEKVSIKQLARSVFLLDPTQPTSQSTKDSDPSWTLGLSYQASDDVLLYVTHRRSWRSGGFNGTAPPTVAGLAGLTNKFKPEVTYDVELGAKFEGSVLDRPVRANLAVFNQWIKDVQRAEFPTPPGGSQSIAYTVNVPKAQISGLEVDLTIKPLTSLELGLSGAWTYARFVKGDDTAVVFGTTYLFGPYADVPRASGSLYATVNLPTPEQWGGMDLRADLYGQTKMYFANNNDTITPGTEIPGYGLLNLRYDWKEIMGSKLSFSAYVKNVFEKEYYAGGFALTASLGVNSVAVGTPRMIGAELSYSF
jgi:iron complex outermembrane receptor protein